MSCQKYSSRQEPSPSKQLNWLRDEHHSNNKETPYLSPWFLPKEEENHHFWFSHLYSWLEFWDYGKPLASKWAICHKLSERICNTFFLFGHQTFPVRVLIIIIQLLSIIFARWKIFKHHCDRYLLRRPMSILRLHHFSIKRDLHPRFRSNLQLKCAKMSDRMQVCDLNLVYCVTLWRFSFLFLLTTVNRICGSLY